MGRLKQGMAGASFDDLTARQRMTTPSPPRRRWFSFSLRTAFILLTLFCVWLGVQVKWIRDRHEALTWYQNTGCGPAKAAMPRNQGHSANAPWSIRILGESGCPDIVLYRDRSRVTAEEGGRVEARVRLLFPEANVFWAMRAASG